MMFKFNALQLAAILGVLVPFGVALLTKANASPHLKSVVSTVLSVAAAVGGALGAYGPGRVTISEVLPSVLIAAATATGTRFAFTKEMVDGVAGISAAFGLGPKNPVPPVAV